MQPPQLKIVAFKSSLETELFVEFETFSIVTMLGFQANPQNLFKPYCIISALKSSWGPHNIYHINSIGKMH